jgi:multimeric flavodoxin WrbA
MKKSVLAISASPRKGGNSDLLCDQFLTGARESGNDVEKIFLCDMDVGYCKGCGTCTYSGKCILKDDAAGILDKMMAADVIVLATPVYFYTMDAQLKTLIDRTSPVYTKLTDKEFYFILTAADENKESLKKTVESLRGFTEDCLEGAKEMGIVYGTGVWKKGEVRDTVHMSDALEMGRKV